MDGGFGGLELGFVLGWLLTVGIRCFVYHQPLIDWRLGVKGG
jgi:hypothetical protein